MNYKEFVDDIYEYNYDDDREKIKRSNKPLTLRNHSRKASAPVIPAGIRDQYSIVDPDKIQLKKKEGDYAKVGEIKKVNPDASAPEWKSYLDRNLPNQNHISANQDSVEDSKMIGIMK